MTIWDNIYKKFKQGGEAWASLSEEIHPLFIQFLRESDFNRKHVLDIGCGTGKYLKYLQAAEFKTDGIDSSETAVAMTKKVLGDHSPIVCANMFAWSIPRDKYDLVISISTIHHGTKDQIKDLINRIYEAMVAGGRVFITVPDFESSKKWETFKDHEEIAEGTFAPLSGPEMGLPHSFFAKEETQQLFSKFHHVSLTLDSHGRWIVRASKP